MLLVFSVVLAAGEPGTRTHAFEAPGIEDNGEFVTFQDATNPPVQNNTKGNGGTTSGRNTYAILYDGVNLSSLEGGDSGLHSPRSNVYPH